MPQVKRNILYKLEQDAIASKILDILNITETKNFIYLRDIENDTPRQQMIYDMVPDIRKYFATSHWNCMNPEKYEFKSDKLYLHIIRTVLRYCGYVMESRTTSVMVNNHGTYTRKYTITKSKISE